MRIWLSLLTFAVTASVAQAFDCSKATTPVETAICADAGLKDQDERLSQSYGAVKGLSTKAEQKMLARAQKKWLASRDSSCPLSPLGLAGCVRDTTEARLKVLEGTPDSGPGTGNRIIPVFVYQRGDAAFYDLEVDLYRFAEPKTAGEKRFNAFSRDIAARLKLGPHGLDSDGRTYAEVHFMTLSYVSPRLLSVLHNYWRDEGGAHGNGGVENLNLDMTTGRELTIADVIPEAAATPLAARCRDQIIAEKKERSGGEPYDPAADSFLKDEVIAEHIATLSRWSFSEGEASVGFDAYAIGPYAEGSYECRFAMKDLKALALPGAPLP